MVVSLTQCVFAQIVSNVKAHREGDDIIITYNLSEAAKITLKSTAKYGNFAKMYKAENDVGNHVLAGKRKIVWSPLKEFNTSKFDQDNVRFQIEAKPTLKYLILGEFAYSPSSQFAGGLMFGMVWNVGWYAKFHTSFDFKGPTNGLTCDENGAINGEIPFYSGNIAKPEFMVDAGVLVKMGIPLYLGVGIGYGQRSLLWETIDGKWVKNGGSSYSGFSSEVNLIGSIYGFSLMFGINNINFRYLELQFGVGWMF